MTDIRTFIAISIPPVFQSVLELAIRQLKEQLSGFPVRWVPVRNIHLTLKFLGNVSEDSLDAIQAALAEEVIQHKSFVISLDQAGAFPSQKRPRVIWIGITGKPELKSLARGIDQQMKMLGYPSEDRPFSPHLTLGRVKQQVFTGDFKLLDDAIQNLKIDSTINNRVTEVHLYRSDLTPAGAVYTRLFSAPLG